MMEESWIRKEHPLGLGVDASDPMSTIHLVRFAPTPPEPDRSGLRDV